MPSGYAASRADSEGQGLKKLDLGPRYISGLGGSCGHAQNSCEIFVVGCEVHPVTPVVFAPF